MVRKLFSLLLAVGLTAQIGCYNTYNVSLDELAKAQEGGGAGTVKIATEEGEEVVVTQNTKLGITDASGEYLSISPFNFTLTAGQLVAPDEDLLIGREAIQTGNVKVVSGTKTALLIAVGLGVVVGGAFVVILGAEEEKGFGE